MIEKGILEHTEAIKQVDEELERANGGKEVIVEPRKVVDKVEDVKISRNKMKKCRFSMVVSASTKLNADFSIQGKTIQSI